MDNKIEAAPNNSKNIVVTVQLPPNQYTLAPPTVGKDKWIALALCLFLGYYGAHKFYDGDTKTGLIYACLTLTGFLLPITFVLTIKDCIEILQKPNPYLPS
ncbi:MAG: TM2 domain-containing protein [bacterium]|nr:TM2 domain-containing protein [bacterium]